MPTITFILGLGGSGKSVHLKRMDADFKLDEGFPQRHQEMFRALKEGKDCAVIEVAFCEEINRQMIISRLQQEVPGVQIKWFCIENDLQKANNNCLEREKRGEKGDAKGHIEMNKNRVSPNYTIPKGENVEVVPMWPYEPKTEENISG